MTLLRGMKFIPPFPSVKTEFCFFRTATRGSDYGTG